MDIQKLEEKVKAMLEGEKKRREIALKWLDSLELILVEVAPDLWGEGDGGEYVKDTKYIEKSKDGKIVKVGSLYFRYNIHYGEKNSEGIGWYYDLSEGYQACWGRMIYKMKGKDFWWTIRTIMEWIPIVISQIDEKSESREKLIATINLPDES